MSPPTHTVGPDAHLPEVDRVMRETGVSGLPVVDRDFRPVGVISRTDMLHVGAVPAVTGGSGLRIVVPDRRVGDVIRGEPLCVVADAPLSEAAQLMRSEHVHRVLVVDAGGRLVGLVTSSDVMRIVSRSGSVVPIGALMSASPITVTPGQSANSAIERLRNAHVHGLIVVAAGWPIGTFAQEEALMAERFAEPTLVEHWYNPALLVMPQQMPAHRAAAQAIAMHCRMIAVLDGQSLVGVVTASDFIKAETD